MMALSLTVSMKRTYRYTLLTLVLRCLCYLRLIKIENAVEIIRTACRRGWLFKYRVGKGKRKNLAFDFDYEITEGDEQ